MKIKQVAIGLLFAAALPLAASASMLPDPSLQRRTVDQVAAVRPALPELPADERQPEWLQSVRQFFGLEPTLRGFQTMGRNYNRERNGQ